MPTHSVIVCTCMYNCRGVCVFSFLFILVAFQMSVCMFLFTHCLIGPSIRRWSSWQCQRTVSHFYSLSTIIIGFPFCQCEGRRLPHTLFWCVCVCSSMCCHLFWFQQSSFAFAASDFTSVYQSDWTGNGHSCPNIPFRVSFRFLKSLKPSPIFIWVLPPDSHTQSVTKNNFLPIKWFWFLRYLTPHFLSIATVGHLERRSFRIIHCFSLMTSCSATQKRVCERERESRLVRNLLSKNVLYVFWF